MKHYQIEKSLSEAKEINFWFEKEQQQQPPLILLVFTDDIDISKNKADIAYNELFKIVSIDTTFVKTSIINDRMTLSLIDAVNDLHLNLRNIKFKANQFTSFANELTSGKKFALLLAKKSDRDRPIIVQTTSDFKIITLAGFID